MGASVRPERRPSLDEIVQQVDRPSLESVIKAADGPSARELAARKRAREATNAAEKEALNTASTTVANFLDAGTFGLAGIAQDAVQAIGPETFRANRDARRAIYESMPTHERVLLGVAGGIANPAKVPGLGSGGGLLKMAGRGAVQGAVMGAAQGLGENIGTTEGATRPALAGAATGALFGTALGPAAEKAGEAFYNAMNPLVRYIPEGLPGGMSVAKWREAEKAARRALGEEVSVRGQDEKLGYEVPVLPRGPGMPEPMAIDAAGPTGVARARKAAGTVGGRETFRVPFEAREARMAPEVTSGTPDASRIEARLKSERAARAESDYGKAIAATKGIPVETPSLDALLETPTGSAAWKAVLSDRPDLVLAEGDPGRRLPVVEKAVTAPRNPNALYEDVADETFGGVRRVTVPDAEAIHLMTRYLRNWSKGEKGQVFPEGVSAESARNALGLLSKAKNELPEPFRIANERYAKASGIIDAMELGRTPWKVNPKPGKRALPISDIEARFISGSDKEAAAMRVGKQFDLASRINEGLLTPAKAADKVQRPGGSLSREFDIAGGPIKERLLRWDEVLKRQGDILPTSPSKMPPGDPSAMESVEKATSPSLWWSLTKGVRNKLHERNIRAEDITNTAYAKLMTGTPEEVNQAIVQIARAKEAAARQRVSGTAGIASSRDERPRSLLNP